MLQSKAVPVPPRPILQSVKFAPQNPDNCESPVLQEVLSIWRAASGRPALPARRDIDPVDLPRDVLPHVMLIDVEWIPDLRLRWRLIGTALTKLMERDMTGRWWHDIYDPAMLSQMTTGLDSLFSEKGPIRSIGTAPLENKKHLVLETVTMPLSDNGSDINMLIAATDFRST